MLSFRSTLLSLVLVAVLALSTCGSTGQQARRVVGFDDFVAFWSAGRLVLAGQNPYSPELFSEMQSRTGWDGRLAPMWYPPWMFSLLLPFSVPDYASARVLWLLFNLFLLTLSGLLLWKIYGGPTHLWYLGSMLAVLYVPSLFALRAGQITLLCLFGLVGFLYLVERKNWLAGGLLAVAAVKPHLSYLLWASLLWWTVERRKMSIILGFCGFVGLALAVGVAFNPELLRQFVGASTILRLPLFDYKSPTIGSCLRLLFGQDRIWLRFFPPAIALVGLLLYCWRKRSRWSWKEEAGLLVAFSLPTTLYAWSYDFVMLLPLVIQLAVGALRVSRGCQLALGVAFVVLNGVILCMNLGFVDDFAYFWFVPSWLLVYAMFPRACRVERVPAVGSGTSC
ncbi:MAG: glycosyltransferase family 87 protein [Acidobacteriota bacterium]